MIELNKIYNEDCLEGMKRIPDGSIDMILTDIPYGEVNRKSNGLRNLDKEHADIVTFDISDLLKEFVRITKGSMYIFCGIERLSGIRKNLASCGMTTRVVIWEKTNPSPMNGTHNWLSGIELCVYAKFKGATFNEHCKNSVLRFPTVQGKIHPTQKPLNLFNYLIRVSSNKNDVILDAFMGSGTTAIACLNTERNFIGLETNKEYYDKSLERIKNNVTQLDLFEEAK